MESDEYDYAMSLMRLLPQLIPAMTAPSRLESVGERTMTLAMAFYDLAPKWTYAPPLAQDDGVRPVIVRPFSHEGRDYRIEIAPLVILSRSKAKGRSKWIYPGKREELVEQALRKLAVVDGQMIVQKEQVGVEFTMYQLRKELAAQGHGYKLGEIREALDCLTAATLTIYGGKDGKEALYREPCFTRLGGVTGEAWNGEGKGTVFRVFFHSAVTASLLQATYRRMDYERYMGLKSAVARYLLRCLVLRYRQASVIDGEKLYRIGLETALRGAGVKVEDDPSNNKRKMREAIRQLQAAKVLYPLKALVSRTARGVGGDLLYYLRPSPAFVDEVMETNYRETRMRKMLESAPLADSGGGTDDLTAVEDGGAASVWRPLPRPKKKK